MSRDPGTPLAPAGAGDPPGEGAAAAPAIVVRAAAPADLALLVDFNAAMAAETEDLQLDRARLRAGVAAVLADPTKGRYLVAERGGAVAGQLLLTYEWSDWRNAPFWWIQSVHVAREHRRAGVYRRLHREVVALATAAGAAGIRLYVERRNHVAQATYVSLGLSASHYELFETGLRPGVPWRDPATTHPDEKVPDHDR